MLNVSVIFFLPLSKVSLCRFQISYSSLTESRDHSVVCGQDFVLVLQVCFHLSSQSYPWIFVAYSFSKGIFLLHRLLLPSGVCTLYPTVSSCSFDLHRSPAFFLTTVSPEELLKFPLSPYLTGLTAVCVVICLCRVGTCVQTPSGAKLLVVIGVMKEAF